MKLEYENQWEADIYTIQGRKVAMLKEVSIAGDTYMVYNKVVSVPYDDMGHTYSGISRHFFIKVPVGGQRVLVDLNTIVPKQEVIALHYSLEKEKPNGGKR